MKGKGGSITKTHITGEQVDGGKNFILRKNYFGFKGPSERRKTESSAFPLLPGRGTRVGKVHHQQGRGIARPAK